MEVDANRLLRQLAQARIGIAVQHFTQTTALLQVLLQCFSGQAKGPPCSLHAGMKSRVFNVQHHRGVEHAFRAHLRDGHVGGGRHRQDDRDKAFNWKPNVR